MAAMELVAIFCADASTLTQTSLLLGLYRSQRFIKTLGILVVYCPSCRAHFLNLNI